MLIPVLSIVSITLICIALFIIFRLDDWWTMHMLSKGKGITNSLNFIERTYLTIQRKVKAFGMPLPFALALAFGCGIVGIAVVNFIFGGKLTSLIGGVIGLIMPFFILDIRASSYDKDFTQNLESTMTILTNAYVAEQDFVMAVRNNIENLEIKEPFKKFLNEISFVDSNTERCLHRLAARVDNVYFVQWVNVLVLAQSDRAMISQLMPIIETMNAAKTANIEAETEMANVWRDYFMMLGLSLCIPLIIKFGMKDWFVYLSDTLVGQILTGLLLCIMIVSMFIARKVNKRIDM